MAFADVSITSIGWLNQRSTLVRMSSLPTISTSTAGTTAIPSRTATSLALKRANGSARRRSITSLRMLRVSTKANATRMVRFVAERAERTKSVRKSGASVEEPRPIASSTASATINATIPASNSGVLSRNGLRLDRAPPRRCGGTTGVPVADRCCSGSDTAAYSLPLLLGVEQILQLGHELADVTEMPVDRGKPHVGHLVEPLQFVHDEGADFFGGHLFLRTLLQRGLDLVGHRFDGGDADRALLARLEQASNELLPLEALTRAVFLDHHVRDLVDPLVTGETPAAVEALPPAPDDLAFLAFARVDDLIAEMSAKWALHCSRPFLVAS